MMKLNIHDLPVEYVEFYGYVNGAPIIIRIKSNGRIIVNP